MLLFYVKDAKKPCAAASQGVALGGELELEISCHAHILMPKVQLRLPKLSFKIFGWDLNHNLMNKFLCAVRKA